MKIWKQRLDLLYRDCQYTAFSQRYRWGAPAKWITFHRLWITLKNGLYFSLTANQKGVELRSMHLALFDEKDRPLTLVAFAKTDLPYYLMDNIAANLQSRLWQPEALKFLFNVHEVAMLIKWLNAPKRKQELRKCRAAYHKDMAYAMHVESPRPQLKPDETKKQSTEKTIEQMPKV